MADQSSQTAEEISSAVEDAARGAASQAEDINNSAVQIAKITDEMRCFQI